MKTNKPVQQRKPWEYQISIRGLDPELMQEVHIAAIRAKLSIGDWLNQVIAEKLGIK